MANFDQAYSHVLAAEGGYQNSPNDTGNYACGERIGTNFGIAAPTLQTYLGRCPSVSDMTGLQKSTAQAIYKKNFWDKLRLDQVYNQEVAEIIFDAYVNQTGYVKEMLHNALANQGLYDYVEIPFTPELIAAINFADQQRLFNDFKDQRRIKYEYQATKPNQAQWLKGWLKRLNKFEFGWFERSKWYLFSVASVVTLGIAVYLFFNPVKWNK